MTFGITSTIAATRLPLISSVALRVGSLGDASRLCTGSILGTRWSMVQQFGCTLHAVRKACIMSMVLAWLGSVCCGRPSLASLRVRQGIQFLPVCGWTVHPQQLLSISAVSFERLPPRSLSNRLPDPRAWKKPDFQVFLGES